MCGGREEPDSQGSSLPDGAATHPIPVLDSRFGFQPLALVTTGQLCLTLVPGVSPGRATDQPRERSMTVPFPDARAAAAALAARSATLADLREIVTNFPELRPMVAAYPMADEAILGWLRDLGDPLVDAELARRAGVQWSGAQPRPVDAASPSAGQPVAPAYAPVQVDQTRRVWPVVAVVVAALVLVGGGLGAAFATGLLPGFGRSPATGSPQPSREPATDPTETPTQPATDSPTTPAPAGFVCWDGTAAGALDDCQPPSGTEDYWEYLEYVYPSIGSHEACEKVDSTGKSTYTGITVMWECELGDALIRYRYWEIPTDATTHYARKFNSKTTLKTYDLLIGGEPVDGWAKTDKDTVKGPGGVKRVVVTMWLPEQQLSLSVEGDTTESMWAAFDQVRIRPPAQALGYPASEEPVEAPITATAR